ncbi:MAG: hypothetical protein ACKPB4_06680, partial [Sphaerospermopsis kisseleviana]
MADPNFPLPSSSEGDPTKGKEALSPILISALGNPDKMERAQAILAHFHEIVPDEVPLEKEGNIQKLPSKAKIMSAVSAIETLIKQAQEESEQNEEAIKVAKKEEEYKKAKEASKREEEEKKIQLEEEKKLELRRAEEEKMKAKADQEAEDQFKIRFAVEKKELEEWFGGQLRKAKEEEKARCEVVLEARVSEMTVALDESVAKARRHLEKTKNSAQKVSRKLAAAEIEYKAMVESEEKKSKKKKKGIQKGFVPVETVVETIMTENQRKAKEAHMLSFSMTDPVLNLDHPEGIADAKA